MLRALPPFVLLAVPFACTAARAQPAAADFTTVASAGSYDVDVTVGPAASVKVTCKDGNPAHVRTKVASGKLTIEDANLKPYSACTVTVTTSALVAVESVGSGSTTVKGNGAGLASVTMAGSGRVVVAEAKTDTLTITARGSGDLRIDAITAKDVRAETSGSGTVHLRGTTKTTALTARGSGDLDARALEAEDAHVRGFGSADVSAFASRRADVETNGSGDVVIFGKPAEKNAQTRGSGSIRFAP